MGILSRPRFLPQQRLDLEDVNALLAALRTDSKLYTKQFLSQTNLIYKGFSVTGIGLKSATVNMADATLIIPQNNNDFSWFTAAPSEPNIVIPDADLADGTRNYVEISLTTENNTPLTKAFWDPEANSGAGSEFNQIVATITDLKVNMVVSTGGFSGSPDRLPLCIIDVDGSGNIKTILDRRNLFGRLATPANIDNRFTWGIKVEPVYSMTLTGVTGTFVANETITIGSETAKVVTGGTGSITFNIPSGIGFFPGDAVTGGTSGATGTVNTVSESFTGVDKNLKTQKDINDALMTEFALVKGTRFWWENANTSLSGIIKFLESVLVQATATAKFSWSGTQLSITDDNVSPANDTLGYIRMMGRGDDLALTREDGTGGTSKINIADGEVLYVKIPATGNRNYSASGSSDTNYQVVDIASYISSDETYWLAYREGTRLYIRGYGELEPGEEINIGDPELEDILAQIAANQDIETQDRNIKLIEGGTWSLDETASLTPVTPVNNNSTGGSASTQTLKNGSAQAAFPFTVANTTDISSIAINLAKAGSPTGTLGFELRNLSGLTVGSLIKSSNTLSIAGFNVSPSLQTFTFGSGTIPAGTYVLVPVFTSGTDVVAYGTYSANSSISVLTSSNGGVSYTGSNSTLYLVISGNEIGSGVSALTLSSDAYIQVPGLLRARNRIAAQTINLPNATSVAYVDINRSGVTPAALTVVVADEDAITNNVNRVVIARRVTAGVLVGNKSFLLKDGEKLELDGALAEINRYMQQLKIKKHDSNVSKATINAADSSLLNGNTLSQAIGNFLLSFTGAVINFTTGAILKEDDSTALGTNFTPFSIPVGEYFWYGISLVPGNITSDNRQEATVLVDLADSANASSALAPKPVISGSIKLGAIQVQNIAGTITVVDVKPLGVGSGSGSGDGQGASFDAELRTYLKLSPYEFVTENLIPTDEDDNVDPASTGVYSPATKTFKQTVGQTLISTELLDADFIAANRSLSKARIILRYASGAIDTAPVVAVQKNGGSFQTVTMTRIGNTDTFDGEISLDASVGTSLKLRVTASMTSEIFGYGVMYDTTFVAIPMGLAKNIHTDSFAGLAGVKTITLPFIPDPSALVVYDKTRGQAYVYDPANTFSISGNDVVFVADFFNFPGETISLEFRQIYGNGIDSSDQNANNIATNTTNIARLDTGARFKNYITNAESRFAQRQDPNVQATRADNTFGFDRWKVLSSGGNIGVTRIEDSPAPSPTRYSSRLRQLDATARQIGTVQFVEKDESHELRGKQVTLGFWMKTTGTQIPTLRAAIVEWTGTANTVTSDIVSAWSATPTLVASAAYVTTPVDIAVTSSWSYYEITGSFSGSMNNAGVLIYTPNAEAQNDEFFITQVQLVRGNKARNWEAVGLTRSEDYARCARFYEKTYNQDIAPGTASTLTTAVRRHAEGTSNFLSILILFKQLKIKNPTITIYNPNSGAVGSYRVDAADVAASTVSISEYQTTLTASNVSIAVNAFVHVHITAEAEIF